MFYEALKSKLMVARASSLPPGAKRAAKETTIRKREGNEADSTMESEANRCMLPFLLRDFFDFVERKNTARNGFAR